MTKPDITAVAGLAGRELDAAVERFFYGRKEVEEHPIGWLYRDYDESGFIAGHWHSIPFHSYEGPSFFAMLAKLRERGWTAEIWCASKFTVTMFNDIAQLPGIEAPTLPLALARASLLTTYEADEVRRMQS